MVQTHIPTPGTSPVRSFEPSRTFRGFTRVGNVFMRPLIRSRMGRHMPDLAVIAFTGRRTGKRYAVPVGYQRFEGDGLIITAAGWRANLRGRPDVELSQGGHTRPMHADLIEDPDEVAAIYGVLLARVGLDRAMWVGLTITGDRMPNHGELADAVAAGHRAVIRLTPR